jgi:hypothetical protein
VTKFYKNGKTKAGEIKYVTTCKDCWKAKYSAQARRDKTKKERLPDPEEEPRVWVNEDGIRIRRCTNCKVEKEEKLKEFWSNGMTKENKQKFKCWCKSCYRAKYPDRKWPKFSPEYMKEARRRWYVRNREDCLAKQKAKRIQKKKEAERLKEEQEAAEGVIVDE